MTIIAGAKRTSIVAILYCVLLFACSAHAESPRTMCANSGTLGKSFAEARNNGMPLNKLASNIDNIGASDGLSDEDVLRAKATAALIYTELKSLSPDQTQQHFYRECMKAKKRAASR